MNRCGRLIAIMIVMTTGWAFAWDGDFPPPDPEVLELSARKKWFRDWLSAQQSGEAP